MKATCVFILVLCAVSVCSDPVQQAEEDHWEELVQVRSAPRLQQGEESNAAHQGVTKLQENQENEEQSQGYGYGYGASAATGYGAARAGGNREHGAPPAPATPPAKTTIDFGEIAKTQTAVNTARFKKLEAKTGKQKLLLKNARQKMRSARKKLRGQFQACKKTISKRSLSLSAPACAVFTKAGQSATSLPVERKIYLASFGRKRRDRSKKKKAAKKKRKATKVMSATPKNTRQARKKLRVLRRIARRRIRLEFRKARTAHSEFKKQYRAAKFSVKVLPRMMALLKPQVQRAVAKMSIATQGSSEAGSAAMTQAAAEESAISNARVLKNYATMKLEEGISPVLEKVFKKVTKVINTLLDKAIKVVGAALKSVVGMIPIVGSFLAAAVGSLLEMIHSKITEALADALENLQETIKSKMVSTIIGKAFAFGNKIAKNFSTTAIGAGVINELVNANKAQNNAEAAASEKAAANAKQRIAAEGRAESKAEAASEAAEDKEEADLDREDDIDDEEELLEERKMCSRGSAD